MSLMFLKSPTSNWKTKAGYNFKNVEFAVWARALSRYVLVKIMPGPVPKRCCQKAVTKVSGGAVVQEHTAEGGSNSEWRLTKIVLGQMSHVD